MIFLRWCDHCQQRTAHNDTYTAGITWANGKRVEYNEDWQEIQCLRCKAHTMEHLKELDVHPMA